jgi:hypothetical protein
MPRLTYPVTPAGLAVPVLVGLDGKTTAALHAAGQPIPSPVHARGLVDTCSDLTAVAEWVLQQLAIPPATTATTHTAAGPVVVRLYEVSVSIAAPSQSGGFLLTEPALLVSELAAALPDADVLIGLDLLLRGTMRLDGPNRLFTLDF